MDDAFERLCAVLTDECERQERLLVLCRDQGEAARQRDIGDLEDSTAALDGLIRETVEAETARDSVMHTVVDHFGLPPERQTLTELILLAPEPWSSRLRQAQRRLRAVLNELRLVVRTNVSVFRGVLRIVGRSVEYLEQFRGLDASVYDAAGVESIHLEREPALIDQKG